MPPDDATLAPETDGSTNEVATVASVQFGGPFAMIGEAFENPETGSNDPEENTSGVELLDDAQTTEASTEPVSSTFDPPFAFGGVMRGSPFGTPMPESHDVIDVGSS